MRVLPILFCCCITLAAIADEVVLDDGSRLVGDVAGVRDGVLTLKTKHAGTLSIKMSGVVGITTESERGIAQSEDAPEMGTLKLDGDTQTLVTRDGTTQEIEANSLMLLWPADEKMPRPKPIWAGRVELGFNGTDGNSDRLNLLGKTEAVRDTDKSKLLLYSSLNYAENEDVRTRNEFKAGGRYEWKLNGPWSAFTRVEFEHDEFEALDLRSIAVLGLGYEVLKTERQEFNARFGFGYQREDFDSGETDSEAILDLGYDYMLLISSWAKLRHDLTYSSALDEPTEDFRVVANTSAEFPIGTSEAWKLRTGVTHEYDDDPLPGVEDLDTTWFLNLAYDW